MTRTRDRAGRAALTPLRPAPGPAPAPPCVGQAPIRTIDVHAYRIPADGLAPDGTRVWDASTLVVVRVRAGGETGLGYTYGDPAVARLIHHKLAPVVRGLDAMAVGAAWWAMVEAVRNDGRSGIAAMAISALDIALWDLKARLLGIPLVSLLGPLRPSVPTYGSGGFTSYDVRRLCAQLEGWVDAGLQAVKMKVGRHPEVDPARVRRARQAIGTAPGLFVDANGAYDRQQAHDMAQRFAESDVAWFEEPVSCDDVDGLRWVRDHVPPGMEVSAGEYAFQMSDFRRLIRAQAVDVVQADATRCGGITGFLGAVELCHAWCLPMSTHCAPAVHVALGCAFRPVRHVEYFYDHARIEQRLFDGVVQPCNGQLQPDLSQPGLGLALKAPDAERLAI